jgi:hypothetical protein
MASRTFAVTTILLVFVAATQPVAAAQIVLPHVVVRSYPATPIAPRDWNMAIAQATTIMAAAGVDVEWVDCGAAAAASRTADRCMAPLQRHELALRIVRLPATPAHGMLPLGDSLVDPSHGTAALATIYFDRVEWLARAGDERTGILLGRAIAHELGHLLLRTNQHGSSGLMRPVWTRQDVLRGRTADWLMASADVARIHAALARGITTIDDIVWGTE